MSKKKKRLVWIALGLVLLGVVFGPMVIVYHKTAEMDWHTLSTRGHTEWPLGITSGYWSRTSPFEDYLRESTDSGLARNWRRAAYTGYTFYGDAVLFTNYRVTPAYRFSKVEQRLWLSSSTHGEVIAFHDVLQRGDDEEIEESVRKILESLD